MIAPGCCRHCGCTEDHACRLFDGDTCCWIDNTRTVCSSPRCVRAETARRKQAAREAAAEKRKPKSRFAGMGYGAIVEQLRRERRRKKGKKS